MNMKKSNLIKLFSILLISAMVIMVSANVFAADNTNGVDLTDTITSNSEKNNQNSNNAGNNNNTNVNANKNNTNRNTNTNNSSIYNNTNLPKTGIEDSVPVAMLIVVFGISSVYAYKKIKEYRNL